MLDRIIKDRILRHIWTLFEKDDYYKPIIIINRKK